MNTHISENALRCASMWDDGLVLRANGTVETRCGEVLRPAWKKSRHGDVCVALHTMAGEEPCARSRELIDNHQRKHP